MLQYLLWRMYFCSSCKFNVGVQVIAWFGDLRSWLSCYREVHASMVQPENTHTKSMIYQDLRFSNDLVPLMVMAGDSSSIHFSFDVKSKIQHFDCSNAFKKWCAMIAIDSITSDWKHKIDVWMMIQNLADSQISHATSIRIWRDKTSSHSKHSFHLYANVQHLYIKNIGFNIRRLYEIPCVFTHFTVFFLKTGTTEIYLVNAIQ